MLKTVKTVCECNVKLCCVQIDSCSFMFTMSPISWTSEDLRVVKYLAIDKEGGGRAFEVIYFWSSMAWRQVEIAEGPL